MNDSSAFRAKARDWFLPAFGARFSWLARLHAMMSRRGLVDDMVHKVDGVAAFLGSVAIGNVDGHSVERLERLFEVIKSDDKGEQRARVVMCVHEALASSQEARAGNLLFWLWRINARFGALKTAWVEQLLHEHPHAPNRIAAELSAEAGVFGDVRLANAVSAWESVRAIVKRYEQALNKHS